MHRIASQIALWIALLLVLGGCATEISQGPAPELLEPVGVKRDVEQVRRGNLSKLTVYDGEVIPYVEVLRFAMDGVLEAVEVLPGQTVKAGDVLGRLDETALREQYEALAEELSHQERLAAYDTQMEAVDLEIAKLELERWTSRYARDPSEANRNGLQSQRAALERLQLSNRQAQERRALALEIKREQVEGVAQRLGRNLIVAPFDGRVVYVPLVPPGSRVLASTPMFFVADETRLSLQSVYFAQSEQRSAHAIYARIGDRDYAITLNEVDMSEYVSRMLAGASMELIYTFQEPVEGLVSGQYAAICVVTGWQEDVLYVPTNSLYADATGRYVYRMVDESRERCNVVTGATNGIHTVVLSGLTEEDYVYVKE